MCLSFFLSFLLSFFLPLPLLLFQEHESILGWGKYYRLGILNLPKERKKDQTIIFVFYDSQLISTEAYLFFSVSGVCIYLN